MELKICNIQSFALHDGPGIRTTIFLSGCPLRCVWCHNPETQSKLQQLIYDAEKCIGCRECEACPNGVHSFDDEHSIARSKCKNCGECIEACPVSALENSIKTLTESEFLKLAEKQQRLSGNDGGITFSGGEPLEQGRAILSLLEKTDVHTAIQTCGYADEELFEKVVRRVDYVMFDVKIADRMVHKKYTGVVNDKILKNLETLRNCGTPFEIRTPLIPGITDTEENLKAIEKIVGNAKWEKLAYNTLTPAKYKKIGKEYNI